MPQLCRSTKHHASCLTLFLALLAAGSLQAVTAEGKYSLPCASAALLCRSLPFFDCKAKCGHWTWSFISPSVEPQVGSLRARPCCVVPPRLACLLVAVSSCLAAVACLPSPCRSASIPQICDPRALHEIREHQVVMQICRSRSHVVRGARSCTRHLEDALIGVHVLAPVCLGTRARIVRGARSCTSVGTHTHMHCSGCTILHQALKMPGIGACGSHQHGILTCALRTCG